QRCGDHQRLGKVHRRSDQGRTEKPQQGDQIDEQSTSQQEVLANADNDGISDRQLEVRQRADESAPCIDPQSIHQALPAARLRRAARTGAATPGFNPDGTLLHRDNAALLLNHGLAATPSSALRETATRSAVPKGISPTTVIM